MQLLTKLVLFLKWHNATVLELVSEVVKAGPDAKNYRCSGTSRELVSHTDYCHYKCKKNCNET